MKNQVMVARRDEARSDAGAAAVELALVLPFLLVLVFGIVDFGLAYNARVTLTHAAREGVRTWAITQDSTKAIARTREAAVGLRDPSTQVTVDPLVPCTFGDSTRLVARYDFHYVTPLSAVMSLLPGGSGTLTNPVKLTATGVMRCAG